MDSKAASSSPTFTAKSVPPALLLFSGLQRAVSIVRILSELLSLTCSGSQTTATLQLLRLALFLLVLHAVDVVLFLLNLVWPAKVQGSGAPRGFAPDRPPLVSHHPFLWLLCFAARKLGRERSPAWLWAYSHWRGIGHRGAWGESYLEKGASRSPCPALNALANHGALPRNGRHITPAQMSSAIQYSYNLSPTIAIQLMSPFEPLWRDRGCFAREDVSSPFAQATTSATQGTPSKRLLDLYFPAAFEGELGWQNHAKIQAHVRAASRGTNPQFVFNPLHHVFASGNSALTHRVVGGKMENLRAWLGAGEKGHEELPHGWESEAGDGWGISILQAQALTLLIELGAGSLDGTPRFTNVRSGVEAQGGWNPMLGKTGAEAVAGKEKA
ncbi:hypothetical protein JCM10213_001899 [Rhodosporidiobolus nylandii]